MADRPENPYDMNSSSFDADKYLQKLLKVSLKTAKTYGNNKFLIFLTFSHVI